MRRALLCLFLLLNILYAAHAQRPAGFPSSNLRQKWITTKSDTVLVDTVSILANSVIIKNISPGQYKVNEAKGYLVWLKKPQQDSVFITYRVFPFSFTQHYFHKNRQQLYKGFVITPYVYHGEENTGGKLIDFGNMNYNGSFGRGISFGNNQDVVVNSNLNLQLSGLLADSIRLDAAITDNNIPFQPEGNTQTLQNFDNVFIRFSKKQTSLLLGDFDLQQNKSHFMRFYKRLEGAAFSSGFKTGREGNNTYQLAGAVANGIYARDIFEGQEGNQGPYQLTGNNGEQFLVIIAGTEKVYLDGELLKRGQDEDYVIDYNTGQITFTPKRLITKDSRIQVEFEYSNQYYLNSQLYAADNWAINKKWQLHANIYSNQDAKNSPIDQALSPQQIFFLSQIGDSINNAYYPSITKDTFSTDKILYALSDSLVNGNLYDSVFVYSVNPDSAQYTLGFSYVGTGNGNYILAQNNANGKVYQWVAPVNGISQGDYTPKILLVTPKKQQMFTVGADYQLSKTATISSELAFTNNDVNTFSHIQKNNDHGMAAFVNYNDDHVLRETKNYQMHLLTSVSYEYAGKNFKPIQPYRNVEFNRDWSLPLNATLTPADENLVDASVELNKSNLGDVQYVFDSYLRGNIYQGYRNVVNTNIHKNGFLFNGTFNITNSKSVTDKSNYLRPSLSISKEIPQWKDITIGSNFSLEQNAEKSIVGDTLSFQSYSFNTLEFYVKSSEKKLNQVGASIIFRTDRAPDSTHFINADHSQTFNIFGQLAKSKIQSLKWNITYRNLQVTDSGYQSEQTGKDLLGRLEYELDAGKGFVTASTVYELGSGQEQKLAYTYVQVPAGQGQYTWIDYNKDGIQQANEFVLAAFQDEATYVRIFTPTGEYINTHYLQLNQHLAINPKSLMKKEKLKGMLLFLSKINTQSSLQINRKDQAAGLSQFDPFKGNINDTALLSLNTIISNAVFFNRLSPVWSMDYTSTVTNNKAFLTYGFDSHEMTNNMFHGRVNITRQFSLDAAIHVGKNSEVVKNVANQSYDFREHGFAPKLTYTYRSSFRTSIRYDFDRKQNNPVYGTEQDISHAMTAELKYNVLSSGSLSAQFTYNKISFNGDVNSTVGYNMLNGLLPGNNLLWTITLDKRLSNNLEMSLEYDGRKTANTRIINTGRASIRAIF